MLLQDVRQALRSLWHTRAVTAVAVACLAFGIGLNTTIFSIVDGVLLKPFPYEDPDRIVLVRAANQPQGVEESGVSYPDFQDLETIRGSFSGVAALQFRSIALSDGRKNWRAAPRKRVCRWFPRLWRWDSSARMTLCGRWGMKLVWTSSICRRLMSIYRCCRTFRGG